MACATHAGPAWASPGAAEHGVHQRLPRAGDDLAAGGVVAADPGRRLGHAGAGQRGICVRAQRVEHRDVRAQGGGRRRRGEQRGLERRAAGAGRVPARLPRAAAHRAVPACGGDGPLRP
ncbi:hypothetical protein G6F58_013215 [Rhizopus delemar]|nr:hypothetical protein G6F58_013215 [Rhizopus delemar]